MRNGKDFMQKMFPTQQLNFSCSFFYHDLKSEGGRRKMGKKQ